MEELLLTLQETIVVGNKHLVEVFDDLVERLRKAGNTSYSEEYARGFHDGMDIARESAVTAVAHYLNCLANEIKEENADE